ncbi:MAG: LptA/OstA family protein [Campylobacterota bacterium]|nr:LptA/OstA family protein [Campylobacterota bacterium]
MKKNSKIYIIMIFISTIIMGNLNAEENYLNIDAIFFEADEKQQILYFKGDVKMTKNKDEILCQSLIINTMPSKEDPTKQIPKDYTATGDVSFIIYTEDNTLKGKGDTVFYYPLKQKYIIIGNGYLEDIKEGKKITANKIYIDELTGHAKIDGDKDKPVKFRLKLGNSNDKNETKETK